MRTIPALKEGGRSASQGLALLVALAFAFPSVSGAETVNGELKGGSGHSWRYGYDAVLTGDEAVFTVSFRLIGAQGVTPVDLARAAKRWKEGVERVWNGRYALENPEGKARPVRVALRFNEPPYHHEVVVRPGRGADDLLNWHLDDPPEVVAHEVAHAFGVYDEYRGGATAPVGAQLDREGLMALTPGRDSKMRERFYAGFLDWFRQVAGRGSRLVPVQGGEGKI